MSPRIDIAPGPDDRLDPLAAAVRWWTSRLLEVFATERTATVRLEEIEQTDPRKLPRSVTVALPSEDLFIARIRLPPGSVEAHKRALALRLPELAPLDPASLEVATRRAPSHADPDDKDRPQALYLVAMARTERLAALEQAALTRGSRRVRFCAAGEHSLRLETTRARQARLRSAMVDAALALALATMSVAAVSTTTRALERDTDALLAADQAARRAAVASERAAREAQLADGLVARGVLDRRAGVALDELAALDAATPDAAWWTRVRWVPGEVNLTGASGGATTAVEGLSKAASGWGVALAGPVRAGADRATQTFELKLTRQEAGRGR
jgi:hypothetical protein